MYTPRGEGGLVCDGFQRVKPPTLLNWHMQAGIRVTSSVERSTRCTETGLVSCDPPDPLLFECVETDLWTAAA